MDNFDDSMPPCVENRDQELWSEHELQVVVDYYTREGVMGVAARLGGTRQQAAIYQKACALGLRAPSRWSREEEADLDQMVDSGMTLEEVAGRLGRTRKAVEMKSRKLRWRREEEQHNNELRRTSTDLAALYGQSDGKSFLKETSGAAPLGGDSATSFHGLGNEPERIVLAESNERRRVQRYTVARVQAAMAAGGSAYVEGVVRVAASRVLGRCRCGELVTKRAENWVITPGGCQNCRPTTCMLSRAEDRLGAAVELAEGWGGGICHQVEPKTKADKVAWYCSLGHVWEATISSVASGTWCPQCNPLKSEQIARSLLEQALEAPFPKVRPEWLRGLELDGFNAERKLAFEYQGKWHETDAQASRDEVKRQLCAVEGVMLIEVWHQDARLGVAGIRAALGRELQRLGIAPLQALATISPSVVPYGVQAEHKSAFERQLAIWGWAYDSARWVNVDEKVLVDPRDGGELILALPRTVIKGMLPGRLASNAVMTDAERHARFAENGWIWVKTDSYVNAHQKLRLISPTGQARLMTWNKWSTRYEGKTRGMAVHQLELEGLGGRSG